MNRKESLIEAKESLMNLNESLMNRKGSLIKRLKAKQSAGPLRSGRDWRRR